MKKIKNLIQKSSAIYFFLIIVLWLEISYIVKLHSTLPFFVVITFSLLLNIVVTVITAFMWVAFKDFEEKNNKETPGWFQLTLVFFFGMLIFIF